MNRKDYKIEELRAEIKEQQKERQRLKQENTRLKIIELSIKPYINPIAQFKIENKL